jgi:uncharacterized damage-inducible protein DinB
MPTPTVIATAAENFRYNSAFLTKLVQDLSPDEWMRRPQGNCNHLTWIVGHLVWSRKQILARLGREWSLPWLGGFARGAKCEDDGGYPSEAALLDGWREAAGILDGALDAVSPELLAQPATSGPPSADGKVSGIINFLAFHEIYHIGQASYLRGWLGHKGMMG